MFTPNDALAARLAEGVIAGLADEPEWAGMHYRDRRAARSAHNMPLIDAAVLIARRQVLAPSFLSWPVIGGADLATWQAGRCAVCADWPIRPRSVGGETWSTLVVLDHDHATGRVRGYLCSGCNTTEGLPTWREADCFVLYRRTTPARLLGLADLYKGSSCPDPPPS